jgi:hypothetical protein
MLLDGSLQTDGIVVRHVCIMDGAGAHDDEQPVVAVPLDDLRCPLSGRFYRASRGGGDGKLVNQKRRRDQRLIGYDIAVFERRRGNGNNAIGENMRASVPASTLSVCKYQKTDGTYSSGPWLTAPGAASMLTAI